MLRYVIRRVLYAIPTLFGVLILTWLLFFGTASPEVIARRNLSTRNPSPAQIFQWLGDHGYGEPTEKQMQESAFGRFLLGANIRPKPAPKIAADKEGAETGGAIAEGGADAGKSLAPTLDPDLFQPSAAARLMQLKRNTWDMLFFDFGKSDASGEEIKDRIKSGARPSLYIQAMIFTSALVTSILAAIALAYFRGTYIDVWGTVLCVILMSIVYMVYIIGGQYWLGRQWKWGPVWGFDSDAGLLKFFILPVVVGVIAGLGVEVRLYRTFLLDEINQDYVRTARAKGVDEGRVLLRHVLKNALIPIITSTVAAIPGLILGGILLENFFGIPGLGSYLVDAINAQDFAVVRAMVFLGTLLTIVGLILTDIAYALADPRVRLE